VDVPTALLRDVFHLTSTLGVDGDDLRARLIALSADLKAAIPSYRGLQVTILVPPQPVDLVLFLPPEDGEQVTTSLRLPLAVLGPGFDTASQVVFYAVSPGAFVDLAADLSYALNLPTATGPVEPGIARRDGDGQRGSHRPARSHAIALDADLPPSRLSSGLIGLSELSTINQAFGVLIEQGEHPDRVHAALVERASRDGVAIHVYAARLLRAVTTEWRRPPESE
jgi:hypothetical protein